MSLVICGLILFSAQPSFAACTSPAGTTGNIDYTSSGGINFYNYCDGTNWVPWAGMPVTGAPAPQYSSAGSVTPGGADSQVQYNSGGAFGGDANFVWDDINGRLGIKDATPDVELDVVGDIHYTGLIVDVSDIRLKEDIRPLNDSLTKLIHLNGLTYRMKNGLSDHQEFGFSAQEVNQVFPDLVVTADDKMGTMAVNYIGLIAPMVEAIKEQQVQIEALSAEIEFLKSTQRNNSGGK